MLFELSVCFHAAAEVRSALATDAAGERKWWKKVKCRFGAEERGIEKGEENRQKDISG